MNCFTCKKSTDMDNSNECLSLNDLKREYKKYLDCYEEEISELKVIQKEKLNEKIKEKSDVLKNEIEKHKGNLYKQVNAICDKNLELKKEEIERDVTYFTKKLEELNQMQELSANDLEEYEKIIQQICLKEQEEYDIDIDLDFTASSFDLGDKKSLGQLQYKGQMIHDINDVENINAKENEDLNHVIKRNNSYLASASENSIKIWDLDTSKCVRNLEGHKELIISMHYVGNGLLATSSIDKTIKLWDISSGSCVHRFIDAHDDYIFFEVLNKDTLLSASKDGTIKAWDIVKRELKYTIRNQESNLSKRIEFARLKLINESKVATLDFDLVVKIWDLKEKKCIHEFKGSYMKRNKDLIVIENSKLVIFNLEAIIIWDVNEMKEIKCIFIHKLEAKSIAWLEPDILLLGTSSGSVLLFSIEKEDVISSFDTLFNAIDIRRDYVELKLIAPNRLVTCSSERKIKIWDVKAHKCIQTLIGHEKSAHDFTLVKI